MSEPGWGLFFQPGDQVLVAFLCGLDDAQKHPGPYPKAPSGSSISWWPGLVTRTQRHQVELVCEEQYGPDPEWILDPWRLHLPRPVTMPDVRRILGER